MTINHTPKLLPFVKKAIVVLLSSPVLTSRTKSVTIAKKRQKQKKQQKKQFFFSNSRLTRSQHFYWKNTLLLISIINTKSVKGSLCRRRAFVVHLRVIAGFRVLDQLYVFKFD